VIIIKSLNSYYSFILGSKKVLTMTNAISNKSALPTTRNPLLLKVDMNGALAAYSLY
jgi:hypothetical protein